MRAQSAELARGHVAPVACEPLEQIAEDRSIRTGRQTDIARRDSGFELVDVVEQRLDQGKAIQYELVRP